MKQKLYIPLVSGDTREVPGPDVDSIVIRVLLPNGTDFFYDVAELEISSLDGSFTGRLGPLSRGGQLRCRFE
jgi:hypothetical protein